MEIKKKKHGSGKWETEKDNSETRKNKREKEQKNNNTEKEQKNNNQTKYKKQQPTKNIF